MPVIRKRTISEEVSILSDVRRKMFSEQSKPTNADRIRAMSDEELAEALFLLWQSGEDIGAKWCDGAAGCIDEDGDIHCDPDRHRACIVKWLRQPAEEDGV